MGIAINKMFAQLLFWLYEFLDTIFEMFRVLCGIDTVSVEGTDGGQSILNVFLQASNVTKAFLLIFLVAILVAAVSTIVAVVKNIVNMKGGERKSHARTVGQGFGTIIITGVMAFVMLFGITMSNYVLIKVNDATAPDSGLTISAQLFDMSVGKSYEYEDQLIYEPIPVLDEFGRKQYDDEGNLIVERDEQGNIVYEEKRQLKLDENGNPITTTGWRNEYTAADIDFSYMSPDDVFGVHKKTLGLFEDADKGYTKDPMVEMESFNFWTAYLVVIVMLVAIIFSMLGLVKRIFDIVLLFIVLPLISATIPLDDGARFKQWRDTVVSKVILAYGAILSVNVFLLIVPTVSTIDSPSLGGRLLRKICSRRSFSWAARWQSMAGSCCLHALWVQAQMRAAKWRILHARFSAARSRPAACCAVRKILHSAATTNTVVSVQACCRGLRALVIRRATFSAGKGMQDRAARALCILWDVTVIAMATLILVCDKAKVKVARRAVLLLPAAARQAP